MVKISDKVVAIFVGAVLAAALIPVGLQLLAGQVVAGNLSAYGGYNWSGTDTIINPTVLVLYSVISIAIIVTVVVVFFKMV